LYPIVPIVGGVACLGVMIQMEWQVQGIGVGIVLVGIAWYQFYAKEKAISTTLIGEAVAPREEELEEEAYRVVVPVSNPNTERPLLKYAAASAASQDQEGELVAVNVIEVPPQTSPAQIEFEEERVERQRELLENARDIAADLDIAIRTRAIVGRNAGNTLLSVLEDEKADHVLLGWAGERRRRDVLFGSTIDPLLERAPCDVTLIKDPTDSPGNIVTLAGTGPHASTSAKRAGEFHRAFSDSTLTLLNVQPTSEETKEEVTAETPVSPEEVGQETIAATAYDAQLEEDEYESRVIVADDVGDALVTAANEYDTVILGATGTSTVAQALYGSIPQRIVEQSDGTVMMARGEQRVPRTFRQALIQRLEQ
ncbi:universal stress protein, partial [Natronococcus sp. A-GB1]|uniref:universal stress protein n=1 Tax=Natronococcus sp. A-GB1 TaxID=3037648 RepID=UPI00241D01A2